MKMKTSELTGVALDWAVAKCEEYSGQVYVKDGKLYEPLYEEFLCFSTDWAQGGPIIEWENISIIRCDDNYETDKEVYTTLPVRIAVWGAVHKDRHGLSESYGSQGDHCGKSYNVYPDVMVYGPTPLVAAMRCYVTSKFGDEIKIPGVL